MPPIPEPLAQVARALPAGGARRQSYRRGQLLFREGDEQPNLYLLHRGTVRVERQYQGEGVPVARYGPGDVVGEVSFLQRGRALGSVLAEEDAEADVLEGEAVRTLLRADSSLAARFYEWLARCLGARLVQITPGVRLPEAFRGGTAFRLRRTGQLSERNYPEDLTRGVEDFRKTMDALAGDLRADRVSGEEAGRRVGALCDGLAALLDRFTGHDELVQIGMEDLSAARDVDDLARGVGGYVLTDTFRFFMRSATIELAFAKLRGYAEDRDVLERIERGRPEGDGRLGPLIDGWFLGRPLCRSHRDGLATLTAFLRGAAAAVPGPARLTSLSAGTAREVFELLAAAPGPSAVTCIDADPDNVLVNKAAAEEHGCGDRVTFLNADLHAVLGGQQALALGQPQHVIYGLGVCDYLPDDEVRQLLGLVHGLLAAGGWLVLTNRDRASPDRAFTEHILDWPVIHRTPEEFAGLFADSPFRGLPTEISSDAAGVTLFARCRKP